MILNVDVHELFISRQLADVLFSTIFVNCAFPFVFFTIA